MLMMMMWRHRIMLGMTNSLYIHDVTWCVARHWDDAHESDSATSVWSVESSVCGVHQTFIVSRTHTITSVTHKQTVQFYTYTAPVIQRLCAAMNDFQFQFYLNHLNICQLTFPYIFSHVCCQFQWQTSQWTGHQDYMLNGFGCRYSFYSVSFRVHVK